ncbi:reverse transcriptase domain-containing protein [Artemisia annua]|uniref:Reverse transcriptase domain-containing protein n=1 Tax=Artemisia annua TaxID=35608 RepID=A0A2U1Q1R2_ARTAN|nr:reverse transcriptase domain-containing protein [Artemisia annua]
MVDEDLTNLRITRSRSSIKNLVPPYAEPEREMRRLRQSLPTPEPFGTTINFDEALSEVESDHHPTPPSPQSNHDADIPENLTPKCLKDYSSPTPRGFSNAIVFPNEHTSGVLRATDVWLIQSVCKFHGLKTEDPIQHIKDFLKIVDIIHTDGATRDTSRLRFFPFTLHGKAKEWYNKLPSESIFTWEQLISKFYEKFFPAGRTSAIRDKILRFRIGQAEPIHKSWIRFKYLIRQGKITNLSAEEGWNRIEEYDQDQDDTWDVPDSIMSISEVMQKPSFESRLRKLQEKVSYLAGSQATKRLSNPRDEKEKGPDFKIRSTFENDLGHFTHEKSLLLKGLNELITDQQNDLKTKFTELNAALDSLNKPHVNQKDPLLAITTRAGTKTKDPPYPNQHPITVEPDTPHEEEGNVNDEIPEQHPQATSSLPTPPKQPVRFLYPSRLKNQKFENDNKRFLSYLKDLVVTIPLLDACYHMPKYSIYFKKLLANRKRLEVLVTLGEECSVVTQRGLSKKLDEPGSFTLPCSIGSLSLKQIRMNIQLADRSVKYPLGICENVLVKIGKFKFLVDFVILEMEEDNQVPIILGRPFLATARAVIDVHDGITLRVDELSDIIDKCVDEQIEAGCLRDEAILPVHEEEETKDVKAVSFYHRQEPAELLELRDQLLVIINSSLRDEQKDKLLGVLKKYKGIIAWSVADIKGIDSTFCTHKILMEEDYKPTVQPQRRVNPNMKEVVKKEVIKLLDAGLIYPISDSPWVIPVQVVPKKGGMMVVKNDNDDLVPQRTVTGWRVCIDYRKLNDATRKDHFPLPFIDQMLERLVGHEYYCFLDGFSGYFQIPIAPEDQEKTTFTCPYGTFAYKRMPFGLCNALTTFQRCMTAIFHELMEDNMEVFMDDFSVFGDSFDRFLTNLEKMLKRCDETNLVLNWEKWLIYPISDSPWVIPVQVVPKKGGMMVVKNDNDDLVPQRTVTGWRVCIDYRKLNDATRKDHFPLPFIDQMLERLVGHEYYCFLDGFSGYFQIPIAPEDQEKTTFTCPYGTFAYKRMPFGLCNALTTFQRCMTAIFHELMEDNMEVFMDDFSVFGDSFDRFLTNLEKMLKRCDETNLVLNWEKCHFMVKEGIVLGHKVSGNGIEVDRAKIEAISKLPYPTTVKAIRSFLGHFGFYRRFIKDFSKIARPMTQLLVKDAPFDFSQECKDSFDRLKQELTQALIMVTPNWELPFEIMCDASDYAVGAVLGQRLNKHFKPIYYASKTMNPAQENYTTTKKELLAVVFAFNKFCQYLVLSKTIVFTDHSALRYLFTKQDAKP